MRAWLPLSLAPGHGLFNEKLTRGDEILEEIWIRTRGLVAKKVVLLSERGASTLERRHDVYNLRLGVDGLEISAGFSVYACNVEQRHVTYLGSRTALGRTWVVVVRMGNTRLTYEGFLHFTGRFVKGVAVSRKYSGGRSSLVVNLHLRASVCESEGRAV